MSDIDPVPEDVSSWWLALNHIPAPNDGGYTVQFEASVDGIVNNVLGHYFPVSKVFLVKPQYRVRDTSVSELSIFGEPASFDRSTPSIDGLDDISFFAPSAWNLESDSHLQVSGFETAAQSSPARNKSQNDQAIPFDSSPFPLLNFSAPFNIPEPPYHQESSSFPDGPSFLQHSNAKEAVDFSEPPNFLADVLEQARDHPNPRILYNSMGADVGRTSDPVSIPDFVVTTRGSKPGNDRPFLIVEDKLHRGSRRSGQAQLIKYLRVFQHKTYPMAIRDLYGMVVQRGAVIFYYMRDKNAEPEQLHDWMDADDPRVHEILRTIRKIHQPPPKAA